MDQNEFNQELGRIITSGKDIDAIQAELAQLFVQAGYPEEIGHQAAQLLLETGNDPRVFAQKFTQLIFSSAMSELAGDDQPPWFARLMQRMSEQMTLVSQIAQLFDAGQYSDALQLANSYSEVSRDLVREFREIVEEGEASDTDLFPLVAQGDGLAGLMHFKLGNFIRAVPLLDNAIAGFRQANKTSDITFIKLLQARALLYYTIGDTARATELTEQAYVALKSLLLESFAQDETIANAIETTNLDLARARGNLGMLYAESGDFERALELQQQAMKAWEAQKEVWESNPELRKSVVIDIALLLQNFASTLQAVGQRELARTVFLQAVEVYEELEHPHPDAVRCYANLAEVFRQEGDIETASTHLAVALKRFAELEDHDLMSLAQYFEQGAILSAAAGVFDQALEFMRQSGELYDELVLRVLPAAAEKQRLHFAQKIRVQFVRCLSLIAEHFNDSPDAIRLGFSLVLRRKGLLVEASMAQREVLLQAKYKPLAPLVQELLDVKANIANKTLGGPGEEGAVAHKAILAEWETKQEQLELELSIQIPDIGLQKRLLSASHEDVARLLPDNSALIEFVRINVFDFNAVAAKGEPEWREERYLAFVLDAGKPEEIAFVDLGEAEHIDRLIDRWRSAITGDVRSPVDDAGSVPEEQGLRTAVVRGTRQLGDRSHSRPTGSGRGAGETLRKAVFDPLLPALSNCKRLFVAPDSELLKLPFEALPSDTEGYLLDEFAISYLGSGRDLLALDVVSRETSSNVTALVIADPDYDLGGSGITNFRKSFPFNRLSGTRQEGELIAKLLDTKLCSESAAVEGPLKESALPGIVHIATHGFFQDDAIADPGEENLLLSYAGTGPAGRLSRLNDVLNPMLRSGLALAGANVWAQSGTPPAEAHDGILSAEDVSSLNLLDTELVVLSACETGLGEIRTGEGVFGLRRAFTVAGAKTLVMSLWKVPDAQTRELMVTFYENLLQKGMGRAEALRQSQLTLRNRYPDKPFLWGAFVCQGYPGPLIVAEQP